MSRFSFLTQILIITLITSACGAGDPQATPTINPVDLQSTLVAAASTLVAETQAAIPTATIPPTVTMTSVHCYYPASANPRSNIHCQPCSESICWRPVH